MDFSHLLVMKFEHFRMLSYWLVFVFAFLESLAFVGFLVPGAIIVVLAGFLSFFGFFDVSDLILFVFAGAFLSGQLSYYFGEREIFFFGMRGKIFKMEYYEKAKIFFGKHKKSGVISGKFIGHIRPAISFVAGKFRMRKINFFPLNLAGSLLWASAYVLVGYVVGKIWSIIGLWSTRAEFFILVILLFLVLFYIFKWIVFKKGRKFFSFLQTIIVAVWRTAVKNKISKKLLKNHPKFFGFWRARFERGNFFGLPLTFLAVSFLYVLSLLLGVVQDIISSSQVVSTDFRVNNLLHIFRSPVFVKMFLWVTVFGIWPAALSAVAVVVLLLLLWNKREYIFPFLIAISGSQLFEALGKFLFHRARPGRAVYLETSYSFPSGHASFAIAFWGFVVYFFWRNVRNWNRRINILFIGLIIVIAIGFSRLYLGVHFLSDVIGGYLIGLLWLIIGISLVEWFYYRRKEKIILSGRDFPDKKMFSAILIFSWVAFYIFYGLSWDPIMKQNSTPAVLQTVPASDVISMFDKYGLPRSTETLLGNAQEPISFIIIANDDGQFVSDFKKAGWSFADPIGAATTLKIAQSVILNTEYDTGMMSPYFWNNNVNDYGVEKETGAQTIRERNHARFWKTGVKTTEGKNIYVGTASLDVGIKWGVIHRIGPDIDAEREKLFSDLEKAGDVAAWSKDDLVGPTVGENFAGDKFFTDGKAYFVNLK